MIEIEILKILSLIGKKYYLKNMIQEIRLKNTGETRNCLLEEVKQNGLVSRKQTYLEPSRFFTENI